MMPNKILIGSEIVLRSEKSEYRLKVDSKKDEENLPKWMSHLRRVIEKFKRVSYFSNRGSLDIDLDIDLDDDEEDEDGLNRPSGDFAHGSIAAEEQGSPATDKRQSQFYNELLLDKIVAMEEVSILHSVPRYVRPISEVVALGASGFVGFATIEALNTKKTELPIYVGVRNLSSSRVAPIKNMAPKIQLKRVDVASVDSVSATINEGSAVLLIPPGGIKNKQLTLDAIDAIVAQKASHIIFLSVISPTQPELAVSNGQFIAAEKRLQDHALRKSPTTYTIIRVPMFMDNWVAFPIKREKKIKAPLSPDQVFNIISAKDVGEACATIMMNPERFVDRVLNLAGLNISYTDVASALSEVMEDDIQYERIGFDECKGLMMERKMPEWAADGSINVFKAQSEGDPRMNLKAKAAEDEPDGEANHTFEVLGREATSVREWAESSILRLSNAFDGDVLRKSETGMTSAESETSEATPVPKVPNKEGFMKKAGYINTSMRMRYFQIEKDNVGFKLNYYQDKPSQGETEKGTILLQGAEVKQGKKNTRFEIQEKENGRTYVLECDSKIDTSQWIEEISGAITLSLATRKKS